MYALSLGNVRVHGRAQPCTAERMPAERTAAAAGKLRRGWQRHAATCWLLRHCCQCSSCKPSSCRHERISGLQQRCKSCTSKAASFHIRTGLHSMLQRAAAWRCAATLYTRDLLRPPTRPPRGRAAVRGAAAPVSHAPTAVTPGGPAAASAAVPARLRAPARACQPPLRRCRCVAACLAPPSSQAAAAASAAARQCHHLRRRASRSDSSRVRMSPGRRVRRQAGRAAGRAAGMQRERDCPTCAGPDVLRRCVASLLCCPGRRRRCCCAAARTPQLAPLGSTASPAARCLGAAGCTCGCCSLLGAAQRWLALPLATLPAAAGRAGCAAASAVQLLARASICRPGRVPRAPLSSGQLAAAAPVPPARAPHPRARGP